MKIKTSLIIISIFSRLTMMEIDESRWEQTVYHAMQYFRTWCEETKESTW